MSTDTAIKAKVVKVGPIQFTFTINVADIWEMKDVLTDLQRRHPYIKRLDRIEGYSLPGGKNLVRTFMAFLDEDADYHQLCALRAELNSPDVQA